LFVFAVVKDIQVRSVSWSEYKFSSIEAADGTAVAGVLVTSNFPPSCGASA
jgi:hypothetical protein